MKKNLELVRAEMKEGVEQVLKGKKKIFKSHLIFPRMIHDYMHSRGFKQISWETNGWQYDWWLNFQDKDGKSYTAFGSGYDGDFIFERTPGEDNKKKEKYDEEVNESDG